MVKTMIIPAVRNNNEFDEALNSKSPMIFDLNSSILNLEEKIKKAHQKNKKLFIHIDLAEGIGKDKEGIQYLKNLGVDGIISTRSNIIKYAREIRLSTIQRFFLLDSQSVNSIMDTAKVSKPDMIEIMPGVIYKIICNLKKELNIPIITGGLIETQDEIDQILKSGAFAISTSKKTFWK